MPAAGRWRHLEHMTSHDSPSSRTPARNGDGGGPDQSVRTTVPADALTERFYSELREIAHRVFASERSGHTLQPTAVVNEACLRLMKTSPAPDASRADRLALGARVLRQVLIDHARTRNAEKRGRSRIRIELTADVAAPKSCALDASLDDVHVALEQLRSLNERQADVIVFRAFGGMTMQQIAEVLGVSKRSVEADWTVARAWLRRELSSDNSSAEQ